MGTYRHEHQYPETGDYGSSFVRLTRAPDTLFCTHASGSGTGGFESDFNLDLTTTEHEWLRTFLSGGGKGNGTEVSSYLRKAGCTEGQVNQITRHVLGSHHLYSGMPASCRVITNGERVEIGGRYWRVMVAFGHSREHACFYCQEDGILIEVIRSFRTSHHRCSPARRAGWDPREHFEAPAVSTIA